MKFHNTAPQVDHFVFTVGHTVFVLEGRRPPKEFDEIVAKLHFIVLVQRPPSLARDNQITSVSRLKTPSRMDIEMQGSAEVVVAGSGLGVRVVDIRVETQPICTNSSQIELVPGGLRMLKKFLGTVSSWTKQV